MTVFSSGKIGQLELPNRIIKAATYEGMTPGGVPNQQLLEHHRELAAGGVGMTTVAYCAVAPEGRTFSEQMAMDARTAEHLRPLTEAVHAEGGRVSLQLGHCGGFSKDLANAERRPRGPAGPSRSLNRYGMLSGLVWARAMTRDEIDVTVEQFADAAEHALAAGFDAVELHLGHGYLLSQFLSPFMNKRSDEYGGSLDNRLRFPLRVVAAVRARVGEKLAIVAKTNLRDHVRGGLEIEDAVKISQALESQRVTLTDGRQLPGVDAIVLSGGLVSHSAFYLFRGKRPLRSMIEVEKSFAQRWALRLFGRLVIEELPFESLFFLDLAKEVRRAVKMPLVLLGGVVSRADLERAMDEGFDFVAVGRALLENPRFAADVQSGKVDVSRCNHCNECVAEMDRGGVRCVLHDGLVQLTGAPQ